MCDFFFNDTATTEIYTLSLHDALPISYAADPIYRPMDREAARRAVSERFGVRGLFVLAVDRKSTRLNSSHANISYAVFCLKKKKSHKYRATPSIKLSTHAKILLLLIKY